MKENIHCRIAALTSGNMNILSQIFRLRFIWLACVLASTLPVSAQLNSKQPMQKQIDDLIAREQIDLGEDTKTTNIHQGHITLADIERVTGSKMKEQSLVMPDRAGSVYHWQDSKEPAEICIVYLDNPKLARQWAVLMLLSVEGGRTKEGHDLIISNPRIGDLAIRPKKRLSDPHGFDVRDTDKTLCIFTRGSTMVGVDSKRNLDPVVPVIDIAKKIDALLIQIDDANKTAQRTEGNRSIQETNSISTMTGSFANLCRWLRTKWNNSIGH